ncbi:MAG: PepSY domain-containing protein [Hyphomicrobium sp.]|nr:PepSY domain-containing protein [Hyphomicrobium sp.]
MERFARLAGLSALALAACAAPALASPECTTEPKDKWLAEDAMKAKVAELGYTFSVFKVEGNCYEIYGKNKEGKEVEVYFNPVTAEVVEEEIEDK